MKVHEQNFWASCMVSVLKSSSWLKLSDLVFLVEIRMELLSPNETSFYTTASHSYKAVRQQFNYKYKRVFMSLKEVRGWELLWIGAKITTFFLPLSFPASIYTTNDVYLMFSLLPLGSIAVGAQRNTKYDALGKFLFTSCMTCWIYNLCWSIQNYKNLISGIVPYADQ